jgi:hypothetical protein
MSHADYLDRVRATWTTQISGQWSGLLFEHQIASELKHTKICRSKDYAHVDDGYYCKMVAIVAVVSLATVSNPGQLYSRASEIL